MCIIEMVIELVNKTKRQVIKAFAIILVIILLLSVGYYVYKAYENIEIVDNYMAEKTKISTFNAQNVDNSDKNIAYMIEKINKSVCGISKLSNTGNSILSTATETELGLGTGIVVTSNGYILSNSHVTGAKYSTCYVTIEDKDTYAGTVVWSDTSLDLSLTKIKAENLIPASFGISKSARVGEIVYAIGNPIGYQFRRTVTSGIISALNRTVKLEENNQDVYMSDLIQTDATINPGNSGGPLVNKEGEVIGVNSVKITSAEGIGFAVPIDVIKPVIDSFYRNDNFEEANLGVYVYDESVSKYLNFKDKFKSGIYIAQIAEGGPSDGKGLRVGDIITKVDDVYLKTVNDLRQYVYTKNPGDKIILNINKGRYTRDIEITLGKK